MENKLKILFFGDITGRQGRTAVKNYLEQLRATNNSADFVIANIENASHGFGLTKKNYIDLSEAGIDCFTSGNHIWDKKDVYEYIDTADNLVRPINYPEGTPGEGCKVFSLNSQKIAVINVLGRVFMPPIDSPWKVVTNKIEELIDNGVDSIFIDFHAEATAEKICFAKYISQKFNSAEKAYIKGIFGTHTHVQTADNQILNGMAYITDAGFCGATNSVIGMEFATSFKRLSTSLPERYEISEDSCAQINGIEVYIDEKQAIQIKRINLITDNNIQETEVSFDSGV